MAYGPGGQVTLVSHCRTNGVIVLPSGFVCRRRQFMETGIGMGKVKLDRPDEMDLEGFGL